MSSSNRHWPSMFKSKPCNPHSQCQNDIHSSLMPTGCQRNPYNSGGEDRTPEPKPRWNPKPEQIRILEAIFNSGMVNPPRDEIRKIRLQLQEFGQVGDANVFYWFQNRKSRSKHKLRHLQNSRKQNAEALASLCQITPPSSSSSSSDKSPSKEFVYPNGFSFGFSSVNDAIPNSPTTSVNQTYFQTQKHNDTMNPPVNESFYFPMHNNGQGALLNNTSSSLVFSVPQLSNSMIQSQSQCEHNVGPCNNLLLNEMMMNHQEIFLKNDQDQHKALKTMNHNSQLSFSFTSSPTTTIVPPAHCPIIQLEGVGEVAENRVKCTVFINDVAFEVMMGPFNVRQAFGDEAVLIYSSGNPVPTDEWGFTLHPLQHGAYYYLIY